MTNLIDQQFLLIKSIASGASLEFSDWTSQWYVSASIEIGGDGVLIGITEHRETPELAVSAFLDAMQSVEWPSHYLVTDSYKDKRREWRWNGTAFTDCTRQEVLDRARVKDPS
jgi:hypothetical protein